jgi:hypothetical protein
MIRSDANNKSMIFLIFHRGAKLSIVIPQTQSGQVVSLLKCSVTITHKFLPRAEITLRNCHDLSSTEGKDKVFTKTFN